MQRRSCKSFVTAFYIACLPVGSAFTAEPEACASPAQRAFDFWVGSWEVRLEDGRLAGANEITLRHGGCLLEERWRGVQGGTGTSLNYFDPVDARWHQLWVSRDAILDIAGDREQDRGAASSMVLEGTIKYVDSGDARSFRGTWTPLADGRVRQLFEEQRDGDWSLWFEGFYTKVVE